jgi:dTMP kinase
VTFVLDAPTAVGLSRAASRRRSHGEAADRFEAETEPFHERLRQAFLEIASSEPTRCVVIDADRDSGEVEEEIWALVETRLRGSEVEPTERST